MTPIALIAVHHPADPNDPATPAVELINPNHISRVYLWNDKKTQEAVASVYFTSDQTSIGARTFRGASAIELIQHLGFGSAVRLKEEIDASQPEASSPTEGPVTRAGGEDRLGMDLDLGVANLRPEDEAPRRQASHLRAVPQVDWDLPLDQ